MLMKVLNADLLRYKYQIICCIYNVIRVQLVSNYGLKLRLD